jgi:hypothetical protein
VTPLEQTIREVIRQEIRRLIRPDAFAANDELQEEDDPELRQKAQEVATRFRRVRSS